MHVQFWDFPAFVHLLLFVLKDSCLNVNTKGLKCVCVCVCVTDAVCSKGRSILVCTCILHHMHCSRLHCDSYMCGCSWVPTDQVDTLQHSNNKMLVFLTFSHTCSLLYITPKYLFTEVQMILWEDKCFTRLHHVYYSSFIEWTHTGSRRCQSILDNTDRSHQWGYKCHCWCSCSSGHSSSQSDHWNTLHKRHKFMFLNHILMNNFLTSWVSTPSQTQSMELLCWFWHPGIFVGDLFHWTFLSHIIGHYRGNTLFKPTIYNAS